MGDAPRESSRPSSVRRWIAIAAVVLLAYALSLGPVSFVVNRGYLPRNPSHPVTYSLTMFYFPLNLAGALIPPLDELKDWYVWQWIKPHGSPVPVRPK
jgi:hypothetical protein